MSDQRDSWTTAKTKLQEAIAGLDFAISAETRCRGKTKLVARWRAELNELTELYVAVAMNERELAAEKVEGLDAHSKALVAEQVEDWLKS